MTPQRWPNVSGRSPQDRLAQEGPNCQLGEFPTPLLFLIICQKDAIHLKLISSLLRLVTGKGTD